MRAWECVFLRPLPSNASHQPETDLVGQTSVNWKAVKTPTGATLQSSLEAPITRITFVSDEAKAKTPAISPWSFIFGF